MLSSVSRQFADRYNDIKKNIIEYTNALAKRDYETKLDTLKLRFGKDVRSVRQLDAAKDVEALMYLLEKRLLLGWFNVAPMIEIMKTFDGEWGCTFNELMDYRTELHTFSLKNKEAFVPPPYDPDIFSEVHGSREVIPAKLSASICSQMGTDWINFGRELVAEGLASEGLLDELRRDKSFGDDDRMRRLLDIFVAGDKRSKRSKLSKLLKAINRNDLDEEVQMFLEGNDSY